MRRIAIFIVVFLGWLALTFPYDTGLPADQSPWDIKSILAGLGVALIITLLFGGAFSSKPGRMFNPLRIFWLLLYIPVFFYYCVKANVQVVYLVLHPDMPIKPGIVKVTTKLTSESGITALANSITLTPGTLTVDVVNNNELYVHWLLVETTDQEEATKEIVERFEYFLAKIFG